MSDPVIAEHGEVVRLQKAVERYRHDLLAAAHAVRRDVAAAAGKARAAVESRRNALGRAAREVDRAVDAAARSRGPEGPNPAAQRAVAEAQRRFEAARADLARAEKAVQLVEAMSGEMVKALQKVDAALGHEGPALTATLGVLASKLAEISGEVAKARLGQAALGTAKILSGASTLLSFGQLITDAAPKIPFPDKPTESYEEMVDERTRKDQENWAENEKRLREEENRNRGTR